MLHDTSGQSPQSLMTDLGLKLFHGLFLWKSHSEEKGCYNDAPDSCIIKKSKV